MDNKPKDEAEYLIKALGNFAHKQSKLMGLNAQMDFENIIKNERYDIAEKYNRKVYYWYQVGQEIRNIEEETAIRRLVI